MASSITPEQRQLFLNDISLKKEFVDYFWLNLGDVTKIKTTNHIAAHKLFKENPSMAVIDLMRRPENFSWTCSVLFNYHLHPFQAAILKILWTHPFSIFIASRGGSKSSLLAMYALLRALFIPNSRIMFIGSAFRQSKIIFSYCETVVRNAPMFRDILGSDKNNKISHDNDMYRFIIGDSTITSIPLGDGNRIRGQRSTCTISDERNSLNDEIYQEVIQGFSSVAINPVEQVKDYYTYKALLELGDISKEEFEEIESRRVHNQQIDAGTCGFTFEPLYKIWKRQHDIINTKGDINKVKQLFGGEIPPGFDYKDYAIVRLPYELLPPKYMDEKTIGKAMATTNSGIFGVEYQACTLPETPIITNYGIKTIAEVQVGDLVLTHNGRFRKVYKKTSRPYDGLLFSYKTKGYYNTLSFTKDHLFVENNNWTSLTSLNSNTYLSKLKELNNKTEIDVREFTTNYIELNDKIYTKTGNMILNNEDVQIILKSNDNKYDLAKQFNVSYDVIWNIQKKITKIKRKNLIPSKIKLDYNFGLIIGYYAAEGSIGANGRCVTFSLDGHKDFKLESYVKELSEAIEYVFQIKPKYYYNHKSGVISININHRLIVDLIKSICPGTASNKMINHDILFSNREFMKGVIVGYWNGDGHIRKDREFTLASSVCESLLMQMKLILSYFNIVSGIYKKKANQRFFKGKLYNCRIAYDLKIFGKACRLFKKVFYNIDVPDKISHQTKLMLDNENSTIYPIIEKKPVDYCGLVYNLEVEEDESYSTPNATVHNCFCSDTSGFFRRSLIQKCTCGKTLVPLAKKCGEVEFNVLMSGHRDIHYVMGVDPASESDNFAVVVLELWEDHRRIVYTWTTNNANHKAKLKHGLVEEHDYYRYCSRKIRDLMVLFNIKEIAIDAQGGGKAIMEVLGDPKYLKAGENPLYPVPDPEKPKLSDHLSGLHILRPVEFSNADWVYNANHNLKQDMETTELLFPLCDSLAYGMLHEMDKRENRLKPSVNNEIDNLLETAEDILLEVEELKNELVLIEHSKTPNGRDRWDTPQVKGLNQKKGRLRKDRYSALLLANAIGRAMIARTVEYEYNIYGGFAKDVIRSSKEEKNKQPSLNMVDDGFSFGGAVRRF